MKRLLMFSVAAGSLAVSGGCSNQPSRDDSSGETALPYTDVAILSTTDMHGRCWEVNLLNDTPLRDNMLRVSTAVKDVRQEFGEDNVILIDNGDIFGGAFFSQSFMTSERLESVQYAPPMAFCLKEIGYDAFIPGNHEFNTPFTLMRRIFEYFEKNGISVLAGNIFYDGTTADGVKGENVFPPYLIKTITVNGHEHKIGILGFENTDIPEWDDPANYPGLIFTSPENTDRSIIYEANRYIPQMKEEGCEFIIVSYHAAIGENSGPVEAFGNTENQGLRLIEETDSIDFLILGHDHTSAYSNSHISNRSGTPTLIVNAGGTSVTKSVFRFTEGEDGSLRYEELSSENLALTGYEPDSALNEKLKPYADQSAEAVNEPFAVATGEFDGSTSFFTEQTDTVDVVLAGMMYGAEAGLKSAYAAPEEIHAGEKQVDHLDVDLAIGSAVIEDGYAISAGDIPYRELFRMCRFENNVEVLVLTGKEIRDIMEFNAETHLRARIINGNNYFFPKSLDDTHLLFGGMNFTYDLSKPQGSRVTIHGFANGRPFEEDGVYLAATSNYLIGNQSGGLKDYNYSDAVFAQHSEDGHIQNYIGWFIKEECDRNGSLTPDFNNWKWNIEYSEDLPPYTGSVAAEYAELPEEGHRYIICSEPAAMILTQNEENGVIVGADCETRGNLICGPMPSDALILTAHKTSDGCYEFQDSKGRYLSCNNEGGGIELAGERKSNRLSEWKLEAKYGGWHVVNAGAGSDVPAGIALQYFNGNFMTYRRHDTAAFIVNFYEVK